MPSKSDVRDVIFFYQITALASAAGVTAEQYISELLWKEPNQLHFRLKLRHTEQMLLSYRRGEEMSLHCDLICSPLRARNWNHTAYDFSPDGASVVVWEASDSGGFAGYRKYGLRLKKYASKTIQRVAQGEEVFPPPIPEFKRPSCTQKTAVQAKRDNFQCYNIYRSIHGIVLLKNAGEFILIGKHIYSYNIKDRQPVILVRNDDENVSFSDFVLSDDGLFLAGVCYARENLYETYYETYATVYVWEVATGRQLRKWNCQAPNPKNVTVKWRPGTDCVAFHDGEETLRILRVTDNASVLIVDRMSEGDCSFNMSGEMIAHVDCNSKVTFIEVNNGRTIFDCQLLQGYEQEQVAVQSICWHPKGREITCLFTNALYIIDWIARKIVYSLKTDDRFCQASYSPSGKYLAVLVGFHRVQIMNSMSGGLLCTISLDDVGINAIAWLASDQALACVTDEQTILTYTIGNLYLDCVIKNSSPVWSVAWSVSSSMFSAGLQNGQVRIWEAEKYKAVVQFPAHAYPVMKMTWVPETTIIATGSNEASVYLWDVTIGKKVGSLRVDQNVVTHLFWSHDKGLLGSAYGGRGLYYWDVTRGVVVEEEDRFVHEGRVLSPDQQRFVSLKEDGDIWVCDIAGHIIDTLSEHEGAVTVVAWSDDDSRLASGGIDGAVNLWDVASKDSWPISRQYGHIERVSCLAFSPDGRFLASGGREGTVQIWHGKDGMLLATLDGHSEEVTSIAWSPDSTQLMTGSLDKAVCIWRLDTIQ